MIETGRNQLVAGSLFRVVYKSQMMNVGLFYIPRQRLDLSEHDDRQLMKLMSSIKNKTTFLATPHHKIISLLSSD